ncbi:V-type ATP synthase subunit D [bacterium]|nr:V-type ATP synthase subunit D [bacterium]
MAKIKLTKTELKHQRDALKQFSRYLPTLQLKKQQLQVEVQRTLDEVHTAKKKKTAFMVSSEHWLEILNRPEYTDIQNYLSVKNIDVGAKNIAGIDVPVLDNIDFSIENYDLFTNDFWVDATLDSIKKMFEMNVLEQILQQQKQLLEDELRTTNQRVNLFEKVKIPEAKEHIRVIKISLGDEMTASVCRSKIAKKKSAIVSATEVQS